MFGKLLWSKAFTTYLVLYSLEVLQHDTNPYLKYSIYQYLYLVLQSLEVLQLDTPPYVKVGQGYTMNCYFDLEGESLYRYNDDYNDNNNNKNKNNNYNNNNKNNNNDYNNSIILILMMMMMIIITIIMNCMND